MTGMVATVYGRLGKEPKPIQTSTETAMAVGCVRLHRARCKRVPGSVA